MSSILISSLVNAIGCWLCVSLMLYLIFKPEKPVRLAGISVRGILPSNFTNVSQKLADMIYQELITHKDQLLGTITAEEKIEGLMPQIEAHIDFFLREKLPKSMPMIAMLIGDKTIGQIKEVFVSEIKVLFPQLIRQYADRMLEDDRLYPLLTEKLQSAAVYGYITGLKQKGNRLFIRIKLGAFIFGLLYGFLLAIAGL